MARLKHLLSIEKFAGISVTLILRSLVCLLVALVFAGHVTARKPIPLLKRMDNMAYDLRLRTTLVNAIDPRIVIVDIDEKSLAAEGRWPWSRKKISELTDILFDHYQVRLLAYDVIFAEKDVSSGLELLDQMARGEALRHDENFLQQVESLRPSLNYDRLFAESLRNRATILGYFTDLSKFSSKGESALPESDLTVSAYPFSDLLLDIQSFGANLSVLQHAAVCGGYFNNPTVDNDGSFRRLPILMRYRDKLYESLSLAIVKSLFNIQELQFETSDDYGDAKGTSRLEAIHVASLRIPVNEQAVILVPYRGKQGSFNYVSATDVLNFAADEEILRDKIIIFGPTAAGLLDLRSTPVQKTYPGVEIHANIVSGILDGAIKYRPSYIVAIEFLCLLGITLIALYYFSRLSAIKASMVFVFAFACIVMVNYFFWVELNIDSVLATPLLLLSILFAIQITFSYLLETRYKQHLSNIFGQYIPPELVEQMSYSNEDYSMRAESRELTCLFSDVRGFTSISEKMNPEQLSELMNAILTPVTGVIHQHHGTIDKYMGDAVMAFWGAPVSSEMHASQGVTAALNIIKALEELQQPFTEKGWPKVELGVGLNTGRMSVGNMGSEFRMAYTILGDAVNLGSRLEGLTKQYGVKIIVSEYTKDAARQFCYKELDKVKVKGKDQAITIYEPLGLQSEMDDKELTSLQRYQQALELYREQNWHEAEALFQACEQQRQQLINQIYMQRIASYRQNPPGAHWDGVFTHTSK